VEPPPPPVFDASSLASSLFGRLVAVLNAPSRQGIAATFSEDAAIDRHGGGTAEAPGPLLETFEGHDQIEQWLALLPPAKFSFAIKGEAPLQRGDDPALPRTAYSICGPDPFENTGFWVARLDDSGERIRWLSHRPFALHE
jgi:hypothetical protein